jgi:cell wall-associated NlpC family hydrolase
LVLAAAFLAAGLAGPAGAEPPGPSEEEIAQARQAEELAAASVAQVEDMLGDLRAKSAEAAEAAGLAAESYNQAAEDLQAAETAVAEAQALAAGAEEELGAAQSALARVAMSASESQSSFAAIEPFLSADGLDEALARAQLIEIAGTTADRATRRLGVAKQSAEAAGVRAAEAVEFREDRAGAAERAAEKADRAAKAASRQEKAAERERARLITVLAQKRHTTVALEEQAEQARIAAENEAARLAKEAEQAARRPAAPPAQATDSDPAGQAASSNGQAAGNRDGDQSASGGEDGSGQPDTPAKPPADPEPAPPPDTGGSTSGGGAAAVAWARQQIGKPYRWGGSGPDAFDCSGLTSQAYLHGAGLSIPRTAASQYSAAVKVDFDSMRAGDLIFWGSSAAGIYHVAIYSGGGNMIEAPRSGETVTEKPVRWSGVYGYAGRF